MNDKKTKALKQALDALDGLYLHNELARVNKAITAIKEALAQPEQEQGWSEFVEIACANIKAADDAAANHTHLKNFNIQSF